MGTPETAGASSVVLDCAWQFAFNLKHGKGTLGYISDWRGLGGLALSPDIVLWSPTPGASSPLPATLRTSSGGGATADQIKCVAVIESFSFGGESSDPIRVSAYLSKDNQVKLRSKLTRPLPNTLVKLDYTVIGFDEDSKSWYPAIELAATPSSAQINTRDGALQLFIGFEPVRISESLNINVYRLEFEIIPGTEASQLKIATGPTHRYATEWAGEE
ncbi:MAG: hypothetical protein RJA70_1075 [Pseudomonadota bacterium]|jgi:hypothetical protein